MKNPYKTHWYHRQPAHWFHKALVRPPGTAEVPECIHLAPRDGAAPDLAPVRIFLGTEPGQYRATRVFVWSVMKHRDPNRAYEIHLMSNLAGIGREGWKTGFTNYRYAIPHLTGNTGRAIFNDVDQIYLTDPARLFDLEMDGKGVLAISEKENSVMLIDCERMGPLWTLADVKAGFKHAHFKGAMSTHGLYGAIPGTWNSRDGEHPLAEANCIHYTRLQTQPWRPFPSVLRYSNGPLCEVWHALEAEADAAGYLLFTRGTPTASYRSLLDLYRQMHEGGDAAAKANPDEPHPFEGRALIKHIPAITDLVKATGATSVLDYGSGKGGSYNPLPGADPDGPMRCRDEWPGVEVRCYEPAHPPFAELGDESHDGVVSVDVIEHATPFDVPWIIEEMFSKARKFVYISTASYPAAKVLPDGQNAHATVEPVYWWHTQMALAGRRYPRVRWALHIAEKGRFGKSRRTIDGGAPSPLDYSIPQGS